MPEKKRKTKEQDKKKDNKMKNRRGLSTIVVTLILVVIALIAVILLWVPIRNLLRQQTQLTQAQSAFFSEEMNILSVYSNSPYINITIKRLGGEIKPGLETTPGNSSGLEADIFSVNDLSGSMRECTTTNLSQNKCSNMGGSWNSPTCTGLPATAGPNCLFYNGFWDDKLTAAQNANSAFMNSIFGFSDGNSRIGLVAYSTTALSAFSLDLTKDINALNSTLSSWTTQASTCICCGINNASNKFNLQSSSDKMKAILLMTDGLANINCTGGGSNNAIQDAINAATNAHSNLSNLVIYTVGIGKDADTATLQAIAQAGGGQYFSVTNTSDLIGIYQLIAQQIRDRYHSISSFNYLYVKFYNQTDSYQEKVYDMPDVLGSKTYNFNLAGEISGTIIRIEVYPVVVTSDGREIIGPVLASWQPSF